MPAMPVPFPTGPLLAASRPLLSALFGVTTPTTAPTAPTPPTPPTTSPGETIVFSHKQLERVSVAATRWQKHVLEFLFLFAVIFGFILFQQHQ